MAFTVKPIRTATVIVGIVVVISFCVVSNGFFEDLGRLLDTELGALGWALFDTVQSVRIRLKIDYDHPTTRSFLLPLMKREHAGYYNIDQLCDIWDYCRAQWFYVEDPYAPFDTFFSASETITAKLHGDCDDFAILMAAAVRVIGGTALVVAEGTNHSGHAYTLVYIGSLDSALQTVMCNLATVMLRYDLTPEDLGDEFVVWVDENLGAWLSLDWQAPHPGGPPWTKTEYVTWRSALPTPSVLGLLVEPILRVPNPPAWCVEAMK